MTDAELFYSINEPFAAGLFEEPDREPIYRYSNAYRRFWENAAISPYDGGRLYPCGKNMRNYRENEDMAVIQEYSFTYSFYYDKMQKKSQRAADIMAEEFRKVYIPDSPHTVGGNGFTHCYPNYKRLLAEGLNGYEERVKELPEGDFRQGLLILIDGIRTYKRRCLELLRRSDADERLIKALEKVPDKSPENIYEAVVAVNFIYYVDGCDDIGGLDRNLLPYYRGEDIVELIRELFSHVDINDGWSGPLGPDYNEITVQCIKAICNGRKPNLQLLVKEDMPDEIWNEVVKSLSTGCGQPALHNYELYISRLKELMPEIAEEDYSRLAFGGCTETMLEGISCVGSDDAGINTALILDEFLHDGFSGCKTFESFYSALCEKSRSVIKNVLLDVNKYRRTRAKYRSQPVHTLFVDDCIDKGLDFNNAGPRYHWSVVNVAGLINVIDSLSVIKTLVYDEKLYTPAEFVEKLDSRDSELLERAKRCPVYGVDDDRADLLGADFAKVIYSAFSQVECYPSGRYYPVSNQFTTYAEAGKCVRATPDGRDAYSPLCDSMGAIHGNDTKGPTALLNSVSKLPLYMVIGTPVTNIRISREHLPKVLKPLVTGFFQRGGMQLQVSCLSREEMLDAVEHPEDHRNLVVRIGGFSEYFIRLSPELQQTVIARTEH